MPEIPPTVAELLAPISQNPPAGVEDLANDPTFAQLRMQMIGNSPKYAECLSWSKALLKNTSKHLQIAAWLCVAWYRQEKFVGLRNGLLVIAELLERFPGRLYPQSPAERSTALKFLNAAKLTALLDREKIDDTNAAAAQEASTAFQRLVRICQKQFPANGPVLTGVGNIIAKHAKAASEFATEISDQLSVISDQSSVGSNQLSVISDHQPATSNQQQTTSDQSKRSEDPATAGHPATSDQSKRSGDPDSAGLPEAVEKLLRPISAKAPVGSPMNQHESYQKLQMAIGGIRPDYKNCIDWATELLQRHGKDFEVMVWLGLAWFSHGRTFEARIAGLRQGFHLLLAALQKFGEALPPVDKTQRLKAFNFLNQKNVGKRLKNEAITKDNAAAIQNEIQPLQKVFAQLLAEFGRQFAGSPPATREIGDAIVELAETAEDWLKPKEATVKQKTTTSSSATTTAETRSTSTTASTTAKTEVGAANQAATSKDEALRHLRQTLLFFFEEGKDGQKNRKVCDLPYVYGLSRQYRWSAMSLPADKEIAGPTVEKQNFIKNLVTNGEWDKLVPEIEIRFLSENAGDECFRYWLDAQRYVVQALEQKGDKTSKAAQELVFHLARLIQRLPNLPKLMFKDGKTPFAEAATIAWLESEVAGKLDGGAGRASEQILPPIMGEDYEPIAKEYETACAELPSNFEQNAAAMQKAIAADVRRKGRFLRSLNLANFCYTAKKYELAKALLEDLMPKIEAYQLAEWEPALCITVWQSAYLTNLKLLQAAPLPAQKTALEQQQEQLFAKISNYDCVRALTLSNRQS
jgi:type VI secretion system protein VasJ